WMQPKEDEVVLYDEKVTTYEEPVKPLVAARAPAPAARAAVAPVAKSRRSNWLVPVALIGLLGLGGSALSRMRHRQAPTNVSYQEAPAPVMAPPTRNEPPAAPAYVPPAPAVTPQARGGGPLEAAQPAEPAQPAHPAGGQLPSIGPLNFHYD